MTKRDLGYPSPLKLTVMTVGTLFLGEVIVMFVLAALPPLPVVPEALVDGTLISALMVPCLYFFLYKPMNAEIARRRQVEEDLRFLNQDLEARVDEKIAEQIRTNKRLKNEIREKREAREEVWKDQDFIRSVVEAAPCLFLIYDVTARRCEFANSQVEDLLGYPAERALESGQDFLKDLLSPEDYTDVIESMHETVDQGSLTKHLGKIRMKKRSGEWKPMIARYSVLRSDPQSGSLEILLAAIAGRD